jgi:hypothetical protein
MNQFCTKVQLIVRAYESIIFIKHQSKTDSSLMQIITARAHA